MDMEVNNISSKGKAGDTKVNQQFLELSWIVMQIRVVFF